MASNIGDLNARHGAWRWLALSAGNVRRSVTRTLILAVVLGVLPAAMSVRNTAAATCDPVATPIICENQLPGTTDTVWDVNGSGDPSIQGFASDISVNRGSTVFFKINTNARAYSITIYRMGYYAGNGARQVATVTPSAALPQVQPACLATVGLVDCGNWAVSATWAIPATAVSGIYFARLVRTDTGGASHIFFVVRDDGRSSGIVYKTSDTTWQAYNSYGGASLYVDNRFALPAGRAYKVSYNRPFNTRDANFQDFVMNNEYATVRWLEANGYDVSYITSVDADRNGTLLKSHRIMIAAGHDEYWSGNERANVEAARAAGISLAFLTGNEIFWKTRWENSIDGSGTAYRTLVSYKETHANAVIDPQDPPTWTGTWRDPRFSPPADGGRPENALSGTIFTVNGPAANTMVVDAAYAPLRFWRNTPVAALQTGQTYSISAGCGCFLGNEWDEDLDNGSRPAGVVAMESTTASVSYHLLDYGSTYAPGTATHHLNLYRSSSGALVFGAGTINWGYGLDANHDGVATTVEPAIRQATVNLFADMGVQPGTLQPGLVPATASTDITPPTSTITAPAANASVQSGTPVTVSGTATDVGGAVGGVEVSTDGGTTWHPAAGRTSWTYSWTPSTPGNATIKSRAVDDSGNLETPSAGVPVTVAPPTCPCSIWSSSTVPPTPSGTDASAVELGVKFRSDSAGYINGVKFYKGPGNTDTHTGSLWTTAGQLLATATFTNETASGWQTVSFPTPVAISANTLYVASYHTNTGHYASDSAYFNGSRDNFPLHAPASGLVVGGNGVYAYGSGGFPNQTFQATNYWVDVVFNATFQDLVAPTVTSESPQPNATSVPVNTAVSATFSKAVVASSIQFTLKNPTGTAVPATMTYNNTNFTATLQPSAALANGTTYTATVSGATDSSGNVMTAPVTWSFTTYGCPCSFWSNSVVPGIVAGSDASAVELGVKFRSDLAGWVNGIKFYKSTANTGTHVGNLWTATGTLLGTVTFTGESASGWQLARFATPIALQANTTYIASYHTNTGHYSSDPNYFTGRSVDNYPIHALADGTDAGNGVYAYGAGSFPNQTYQAYNYWVDVVFNTSYIDNVPPAVSGTYPAASATGVSYTPTVTATFNKSVSPSSIAFTLKDPSGAAVAGSVGYNNATMTASFQPAVVLAGGTTYTATVSGATDSAGNVMTAAYNWSFTTLTCPCTVWSTTATPVTAASGDSNAIEVGMKFRSDVGGQVTGVRFYKGATNTGSHVAHLWSSTGTLLATATFTGETSSGWQQVSFATPVTIQSNTTYIVSYHTDTGHYASDQGYFNASVDSYPLHVLANGIDGGNGVYVYGASAFPNQTYQASNYWVDVVFNH